jgi:hypothetical protein
MCFDLCSSKALDAENEEAAFDFYPPQQGIAESIVHAMFCTQSSNMLSQRSSSAINRGQLVPSRTTRLR